MEAQEDLAAVAADSSDQDKQGVQLLLQDLLLCIISNRDLNFSKHPLKLQDLVVVAA